MAIVEKWNPHIRRRSDLFGFADLLAMKPGETPRLIQTTSGSNLAARVKKIAAEPLAHLALSSGFEIHVHGWRKLASAGGKFVPVLRNLSLKDLADASPQETPHDPLLGHEDP